MNFHFDKLDEVTAAVLKVPNFNHSLAPKQCDLQWIWVKSQLKIPNVIFTFKDCPNAAKTLDDLGKKELPQALKSCPNCNQVTLHPSGTSTSSIVIALRISFKVYHVSIFCHSKFVIIIISG